MKPSYDGPETPSPLQRVLKPGFLSGDSLGGAAGAHIDLIETANSVQVCNSNCYFACQEIWFWPVH